MVSPRRHLPFFFRSSPKPRLSILCRKIICRLSSRSWGLHVGFSAEIYFYLQALFSSSERSFSSDVSFHAKTPFTKSPAHPSSHPKQPIFHPLSLPSILSSIYTNSTLRSKCTSSSSLQSIQTTKHSPRLSSSSSITSVALYFTIQ